MVEASGSTSSNSTSDNDNEIKKSSSTIDYEGIQLLDQAEMAKEEPLYPSERSNELDRFASVQQQEPPDLLVANSEGVSTGSDKIERSSSFNQSTID